MQDHGNDVKNNVCVRYLNQGRRRRKKQGEKTKMDGEKEEEKMWLDCEK